VCPATVSPLPKAAQIKKRKRKSEKPEVLSFSPYKNTLLATRKEPSNNKEAGKLSIMMAL
jgi:hypothetical protein